MIGLIIFLIIKIYAISEENFKKIVESSKDKKIGKLFLNFYDYLISNNILFLRYHDLNKLQNFI